MEAKLTEFFLKVGLDSPQKENEQPSKEEPASSYVEVRGETEEGEPARKPLSQEEEMERENQFAKKLVESAQVLAHWDLAELEALSNLISEKNDDEEKALSLALVGGEYMERGRFGDSDRFLKKAYKIYRELTGMDNVAILLRLACLYQQKNSLVLAEKFLQKALTTSTSRPTAESIVQNCYIGLVANYQLSGELEKAQEYCVLLLSHHGGSYAVKAKNPLLYCLILTAEGSILLQKNQYQRAQRKLTEALRVHEDRQLEISDHTSQTYILLIRTYRLANNFEKAEAISFQALEALQDKFGAESWEIGLILLALAEIKQSCEKYQEAIDYYKKTLKIYRKICGKIHPNVSTIYFQLGDITAEMGKFEDGIFYLKKAINLIEKWEQRNQVKCFSILAEYYYSLYCVYFLWKKYPEALKHLQKSIRILEDAEGAPENEWEPMLPVMLSNLKAELEGFEKELKVLNTSGKLANDLCPKRHFHLALSRQMSRENRLFL